ncbi:MFS general substrate transporter, partial [Atractiella rhizophila]
IIYLFCYLDRSNIGNAKIAASEKHHNLTADLGISDHQLNVALMLFFLGYTLFETPSNIMLKKLRPSRWIAILCFTWGVLTMCLGAVQGYASLVVVRFLLGAVEAGLFPGLVYYLTFWYRPEERSLRAALILASATLAGAFGGALAYGITKLDDKAGLHAWRRWIFILEGIPSCLLAFIVWFCLPDFPEGAKWLSTDEKALSAARLAGLDGSKGGEKVTWAETKRVLCEWRLYLHYLAYIGISAPFSSLSLFSPSIINGLGYTSLHANLFSVPPYAFAYPITLLTAFLGDHYNRRGLACAITATIAALAFALEASLPGNNYTGRYIVLFMAVSGAFACIPPLLGWISTNSRGTTGATIAVPLNVSFGGCGQMIGVWIYVSKEKPAFPTGNWSLIGTFRFLIMTAIVALLLHFIYQQKNRKLDREGSNAPRWTL